MKRSTQRTKRDHIMKIEIKWTPSSTSGIFPFWHSDSKRTPHFSNLFPPSAQLWPYSWLALFRFRQLNVDKKQKITKNEKYKEHKYDYILYENQYCRSLSLFSLCPQYLRVMSMSNSAKNFSLGLAFGRCLQNSTWWTSQKTKQSECQSTTLVGHTWWCNVAIGWPLRASLGKFMER